MTAAPADRRIHTKQLKHRIKHWLHLGLGLLLMVVCLSFAVPGLAGQAQAKGLKTVRLGYTQQDGFENGAEEGATKSGYFYDYLQQIAAYSGWHYEYVYGTQDELYRMLKVGNIDAMAGVSFPEIHGKEVNFADLPVMTQTYHIFVSELDQSAYPNVRSLRGKKVGVTRGTALCDSLKTWNSENQYEIEIVEYEDDLKRIDAFRKGLTDATADYATNVRVKERMVPVIRFGVEDLYVVTSKIRSDLIQDLNAAITSISVAEPDLQTELYLRYFEEMAVYRSLTSEEIAWLEEHQTVRIGYLDNMAPYSETGPEGEARGLFPDLIRYSLKRVGLDRDPEFIAYQDNESMREDLREGIIDAAVPYRGSAWETEEQYLIQTMEVLSAQMYLISNGQDGVTEHTVFGVADDIPEQESYIRKLAPEHEIVHYENMKELVSALRSTRVGATVMSNSMMSIYLRSDDSFERKRLEVAASLSVGVAPTNWVLLDILNRGIIAWGPSQIQDSLILHTEEAYRPGLSDFIRANYLPFMLLMILLGMCFAFLVALVGHRGRQRMIADRMAHTDQMTDLFNRRAYEEYVEKLGTEELEDDLTIAVMDINGLKYVNDHLGHSAGDELIIGLADCLKQTAADPRLSEIRFRTYRTGGDEFVSFATMTEEDGQKLNAVFEEKTAAWHGTYTKRLSIALGFVVRHEYPEASLAELISIADHRMYEDKERKHKVDKRV